MQWIFKLMRKSGVDDFQKSLLGLFFTVDHFLGHVYYLEELEVFVFEFFNLNMNKLKLLILLIQNFITYY